MCGGEGRKEGGGREEGGRNKGVLNVHMYAPTYVRTYVCAGSGVHSVGHILLHNTPDIH